MQFFGLLLLEVFGWIDCLKGRYLFGLFIFMDCFFFQFFWVFALLLCLDNLLLCFSAAIRPVINLRPAFTTHEADPLNHLNFTLRLVSTLTLFVSA